MVLRGVIDFLEAQRCLSSYDVMREGRDCDSASHGHSYDRRNEYQWESRQRRTCQYVMRHVHVMFSNLLSVNSSYFDSRRSLYPLINTD